MKKIVLAAVAAIASAGPALAADIVTKARPVVAPPPPAFDIAFGAAIMNDYIFRGITQSNHKPSVAAYFEPRYNFNPNLQVYVGISGESISFPNRAAAEIDFYGGIRPTFGPIALDFGAWYYYYPGGQCFNAGVPGQCAANGNLPLNGNVIKSNLSFWEVYAKATWTVVEPFVLGANFYYTPSFLNSGAPGEYLSGTAKYTFPALANGVAFYLSGELGYQWLGTSDAFYGVPAFPAGINYKDYATWNVGLGWTYKVFTVDLRYSDTTLSKGDCNAFTSDHTATGTGAFTPINPSGVPSKWCGAAFIAKLSADLTVNTNLK